jgi:hypothetical protein
VHALCMLDTKDYKHTLRILILIACLQQQLLRLYVRGLPCLLWQLNNAQSPAGSMILPHFFSTCVTNVLSQVMS